MTRRPRAAACTRRRARTRAADEHDCVRARRCRSTGASSSPSRCWARRRPTAAPRSSRPTRCACGTWATTSRIVSFKSKMHTIGEDVLDGLHARHRRGRARLRRRSCIWQTRRRSRSARTSQAVAPASRKAGPVRRDRARWSRKFQQTSQRLQVQPGADGRRGARAWRSAARCEFIMHCDRTVAALESLHRPGRGRRRAAAGRRRLQGIRGARGAGSARGANGGQIDQFPFLRTLLPDGRDGDGRRRARSDAKELGYLRPADVVVINALRAAARRAGAGARAGRGRLPAAAAAAQRPGRRQDRHRHAQDDAGQHARRRLHLRLRLRDRLARRARAVRRRGRARQPGRREVAARARARASSWSCCATRRRRRGSSTRSKTGKPLRN